MKVNASDVLVQIPDNQMPYNAVSILKNRLGSKPKKEITDKIVITTYLDLSRDALAIFGHQQIVNIYYIDSWYKCYVDDFWQIDHHKHDGNLFGGEIKTVIELSVIGD